MRRKRFLWGFCYALGLIGFTGYLLLDTFVIQRVYTPAPQMSSSENSSFSSETSSAPETVSSDTFYQDEDITVAITEYRVQDTDVYAAEVWISSAEYLHTALAQDVYGKNITQKTSDIAKENGAILAVNGDYYGSQEQGYVLREGILYRDVPSDREALVVYTDGSLAVVSEQTISAEELANEGARQILSFGPALVEDGEVAVGVEEEVSGKSMASNPRTAIGIVEPLHYIFVVSDGRTGESEGLDLYELAQFMRQLGAQTAYNLDGGGSSTMVFNGRVVNNPTTSGRNIRQREVSDIVYIGYGG